MIKVRDLSRTECACACGMTFCFQCSREAHAPLLCETLTRWEDKVKDDSATGQWMSANAKRCPKCHMHIEKNGGCNWIACRCGHQFCFFCFSTDKSHHGQPCNAPPPSGAGTAQDDLAYFMHYFDRYDGHRKSQELETALRESVSRKIGEPLSGAEIRPRPVPHESAVDSSGEELSRTSSGQTAIELDYLREAVELLTAELIMTN